MNLVALSANVIEEICVKLDDKSLAHLMESTSKIHQICYDAYLQRNEEYLKEEERQKDIISKINREKNVFIEIYGRTHPQKTYYATLPQNLRVSTLRYFLGTKVGKFISERKNYVYIHEIRAFGEPNVIKSYLKLEGLNNQSINRLMKTAVPTSPKVKEDKEMKEVSLKRWQE